MTTLAVMCWSGGKDSAFALWRLQQDRDVEVVGLLTTLTEGYERVSMQGIRRELLQAQADALGLPVREVWIPPACINATYEQRMGEAVEMMVADGVRAVAFGDLYLQDVRAYRERTLAPTALRPLFPIWGEDTRRLPHEMLAAGFQIIVCCVDPKAVSPEFAGRTYDESLLAELPPGVDPCGENGEFHTFVYAAPNFLAPIPVTVGKRVERDGFWFADLLLASAVS
jgi:uncharacterized protein (TIGR00290 family)